MGLHICYELRLPGNTTPAQAAKLLRQLRKHGRTLGAENVSRILWLNASDVAADIESLRPWSFERFAYVSARSLWERRGGTDAGLEECDGWVAAAFILNPGKDCDSAFFGLVRPIRGERAADAEDAADAAHWVWHSCCKTQYASQVSDEHLVHCHLMVVHMLEAAQALGFDVTVHDETRYWETRSTEVLIEQVHRMNQLVARVAGAFHDAAPGVALESPIFEHPDFERLESEPTKDGS